MVERPVEHGLRAAAEEEEAKCVSFWDKAGCVVVPGARFANEN